MTSLRSVCLAPLVTALLAAAVPTSAAELGGFISAASPSESFKRGGGAYLSTTWFRLVNLEAELARQPHEIADGGLLSFTGGALLAPRVGVLRPYAGVGVGLFRQTAGSRSDTGTLSAFMLGAKLEVGLLLVRGEYRRLDLSGDPLVPIDRRLSFGLGLAF
jgi:hypothetical protein